MWEGIHFKDCARSRFVTCKVISPDALNSKMHDARITYIKPRAKNSASGKVYDMVLVRHHHQILMIVIVPACPWPVTSC